ncbi:ribonuclease H-like domain-containing protein [Salinarchaeum sp. IM2453]|uniref:ribonuclease H-like domain-containing protein n=1 Tax=Salinarchaeum sp. IM2453 TaxID=2862870 RepID=UPI001C8376FA|nr:ribonuclease H-like domain-containing protein [Salinarchaeum sp. IM2453]QZA88073.1 ribonuclease H-like domain-containing protein [Salinarchaeum sp. IM2453]
MSEPAVNHSSPYKLPPENSSPTRFLTVSGHITSMCMSHTLERAIEYHAPDAIIAIPPDEHHVPGALYDSSQSVLSCGRVQTPDSYLVNKDTMIYTIPHSVESLSVESLEPVDQASDPPASFDASLSIYITNQISLRINPYDRTTTLKGLQSYLNQLPDSLNYEQGIHCSTELRSGYRTIKSIDGTRYQIVGIGQGDETSSAGCDTQTDTIGIFDVFENGAVTHSEMDPVNFGIRGLQGVGSTRAKYLRQNGYTTVQQIADATLRDLQQLPKVGRSTAQNIKQAAQGQISNKPIITGENPLPDKDPIYIDIETDGLAPSTVWLIGVLDGTAEHGSYLAFREQQPEDFRHIEDFVFWVQANAADRPIVTWNGYGFDFPVLRDQIQQHCYDQIETWESLRKIDLLWWAQHQDGGNAILPGPTNQLEQVAEALGWTPNTTGINGQLVAKIYTAYRSAFNNQRDEQSTYRPDWSRLERYCEDDVRALASIYEALKNSHQPIDNQQQKRRSNSTQGALSDFT